MNFMFRWPCISIHPCNVHYLSCLLAGQQTVN